MPSSALYEELAKAYATPSKGYRAAMTGIDAVKQGIGGYLEGQQIADTMRQRKIQQTSLSDLLGQNTPDGLSNLTVDQADALVKPVTAYAALQKANTPDTPKVGETMTPEQARAYGVSEDIINSYHGQPVPRLVATGYVNSDIGQQRADAMKSMAESRKQSTQNSILGTAMRYSQAGQAQKTASDAFQRLGNLNRVEQILGQIQAQGGQATIRQRTELASGVARSINPTGVMTNEALNLYIPQSLKGKFGNFGEYLSNQSVPVDFSGYIGELSGLVNREKEVNQGLISAGSQLGNPALEQLRNVNPRLAQSVQDSKQNPLLTNTMGTSVPKKTYQKTAKNAQGVTIGTNDNWATFEPVAQ